MKQRPINFNEYQVRSLLDGGMTTVRRPLTQYDLTMIAKASELGECWELESGQNHGNSQSYYREWCPFGLPGDRLYVKEQFSRLDSFNFFDPAVPYDVPDFWYWADGNPEWGDWTRPQSGALMPKSASRIALEVIGVRIQRLLDASESDLLNQLGDMLDYEDTIAGRAFNHAEHYAIAGVPIGISPEMHGFKAWWNKKYGVSSFESNPWVWVIEFKRISSGDD